MVFIVADIFSGAPQSEDQSNVLAALAVQQFFPHVPFRLMAVRESTARNTRGEGLHAGLPVGLAMPEYLSTPLHPREDGTHSPIPQVEAAHLELAAHVGLNMYNCYAVEGLKGAVMAASLRCPGFATLVLNLCLPPVPGPKAFDAPVCLSAPPSLTNPALYRERPALANTCSHLTH